MNRYERRLTELRSRGEGAFVPFVVLGDPNPDDSLAIIRQLVAAGADALELGIPFSDPVADGPIIQQAMARALRYPRSTAEYLQQVGEIRRNDNDIPIGLLVYANLVAAFGLEAFYRECAAQGIDSVLVADVPLRECEPFCAAAESSGVAPVLLCPPNIDSEGLVQLARRGRGYTYLLSRAGVTGTHIRAGSPVQATLDRLRELHAAPPFLGFGIRGPADVAAALAAGASGVICGSAIIERVTAGLPDLAQVNASLATFVGEMKAATKLER